MIGLGKSKKVIKATLDIIAGSLVEGTQYDPTPAKNGADYRTLIIRTVAEDMDSAQKAHILIFIAVSDSPRPIEAIPLGTLI
jgi:hypothetical protein